MAFVPPKPGGWGAEEKLTSAQMTALQAAIGAADAKTVNGVDGGVYNPAAAVDIQRLAGRVHVGSVLLLDDYKSLQVGPQVVSFELSMVPRHIDMPYDTAIGLPTWNCTFGSGNPCVSWRQENIAQPFGISFALPLPEGATLSELGFTLESPGHTLFPANTPTYFLSKHVRATGVSTILFYGHDPAPSLAFYNSLRTYQVNAASVPGVAGVVTNLLPYTGEAGCHYSITVTGEWGANAVAQSLQLHGIYADIVVRRFEPLGRL